jgi:hypothetical protein
VSNKPKIIGTRTEKPKETKKPKIIGTRTKNPKDIKQQTRRHTNRFVVLCFFFLVFRFLVPVTIIFVFWIFFSSCSYNFWFIGHQTMDKVQKYASTYVNTPSSETYRTNSMEQSP